MLRNLRWQIALAAGGIALIGLVLLFVSNRAFEDRPARGGQVIEAVVGRPGTFNPILATSDVEIDVARLLFSGLTRPDSDGLMKADLAESWAITDGGRVYTFKLRDAVWHDGAPVTSDDVVLTA
ncbi:MAG: ABC transporter substrate-binding protein, partial [Ardenticatenales bacterium]